MRIRPSLGRDFDFVPASRHTSGYPTGEITNSELPRAFRVEQKLALGVLQFPVVAAYCVVESVVRKHLKDIARPAVDVEIHAKVHVMDVRLVCVGWMEGPTHAEVRVNLAISVECPALHVLVPAALKLRRNHEFSRIE